MGQVNVAATIENLSDVLNSQEGHLPPDQIRTLQVDEALVDTGAKNLALPRRMIQQLGLTKVETRRALTAAGPVNRDVYAGVRLTVQGRQCRVDVSELPDECPVLIGFIPLELMDFMVDPIRQRLVLETEPDGSPKAMYLL